MMNKITLVLFSLCLVLAGCARDISPQTYSVGSVGQVNRTISATVISVRTVDVKGSSGVGGAAGAGVGAVAGSSIGSTGRDNLAGAIVGAVVGGIAGSAVEGKLAEQKAMEYVIETENGNLMTIVQGLELIFSVGQRVLVLYGSPARLIEDPRAKKK
jgi:outer membrane lipoprotein SlyB